MKGFSRLHDTIMLIMSHTMLFVYKQVQSKEEKQLELTLDALIQKVGDLKMAIGNLIHKIEHEFVNLNW